MKYYTSMPVAVCNENYKIEMLSHQPSASLLNMLFILVDGKKKSLQYILNTKKIIV